MKQFAIQQMYILITFQISFLKIKWTSIEGSNNYLQLINKI